jgi:hypothetical protein
VHKGPPYGQDRRKKRTLETVRRAAIESRKGPIETIMTAAGKLEKNPEAVRIVPRKRTLRLSGSPQEKTL